MTVAVRSTFDTLRETQSNQLQFTFQKKKRKKREKMNKLVDELIIKRMETRRTTTNKINQLVWFNLPAWIVGVPPTPSSGVAGS